MTQGWGVWREAWRLAHIQNVKKSFKKCCFLHFWQISHFQKLKKLFKQAHGGVF